VLDNFTKRAGGGLLPLGGAGEEFSGYKGYGMGMLVEILSAVLPGAGYLTSVYPKGADGKPLPANLGHFLAPGDSTPSAHPTSSRPTWTT